MSQDDLRSMLKSGQLQPSDWIFQEGTAKWVPAATVEELVPPATPVSAPSTEGRNERLISPGMSIEEARLQEQIRAWLGSHIMSPIGLSKEVTFLEIAGTYLPVWVFDDITAFTRWSGYNTGYRTITRTRNRFDHVLGKIVEERYEDNEPYSVPTYGTHEEIHGRILCEGWSKMTPDFFAWLVKKRGVVHNSISLNEQWKTLPPDITEEAAWDRVADYILKLEEQACSRMASGITSVRSTMKYASCHLLHVPIWIVNLGPVNSFVS